MRGRSPSMARTPKPREIGPRNLLCAAPSQSSESVSVYSPGPTIVNRVSVSTCWARSAPRTSHTGRPAPSTVRTSGPSLRRSANAGGGS